MIQLRQSAPVPYFGYGGPLDAANSWHVQRDSIEQLRRELA